MPLVISDKAALSRIYGRIIPEDAVGLAPANAIAPNTYRELSTPSEIDSKDFEEISTPNQVEQVSEGEIATPNNLSSKSLGEISAANSLTPEEEGLFKQPRNIPNVFPEFIQNVRTPDEVPAEEISAPNTLPSESPSEISAANSLTPEEEGLFKQPRNIPNVFPEFIQNVRTPDEVPAEEISAPNTVPPEAEEEIKIPNSVGSLPEQDIDAPNTLASESSGAMATPNAISPNAADPLLPPFALSHARILYENKFKSASSFGDFSSGTLALTSSTYEYASATSTGANAQETFTRGSIAACDSVCVLLSVSGSCSGVSLLTSVDTSGAYSFVETKSFTGGTASLMFLFSEADILRVRIRINDLDGIAQINVVSAGIALQMQRPIFGGHSPINYSAVTNYNSNASDAGQWLGRDIVRQGLEGSFDWDFLTDGWYREYFQPFVESAKKEPFFISWRPDLYPDEVAYCWTTGDISPSNRGGSTKFMSVGINVQGYAQ